MTRDYPQAVCNANNRLLWLAERFERERSIRRRVKNLNERVRLASYICRALDRVGYQP